MDINYQYGGRGRGSQRSMGSMMRQGMKGMEAQMRQMADTEVDLGYQGEWSGMDCADMPIIDERLQCNYAKWEYDDPLAKSDVKRKTLNRRRKSKHAFAIRTICNEEDPFLCKDVDRSGEPSEKNFMCDKLQACPERGARLEDIPDDVKAFFKLITELFNFNRFKSKKRKAGFSNKAKSVLDKIKNRQLQIKKEYDELPSVKGDKGAAPKPGATPPPGGAKTPPAGATPPPPPPPPPPPAAKGGGDEQTLSSSKLKKRTGTDRLLQASGISSGGICTEKLKKGKFDAVWQWYFSEIGKSKEALVEMKDQSMGHRHKEKEQCFGSVQDGAKKKKLLEEYHKLKQQKLKLSRGPKAALKRLKKKTRSSISKANMKMDKTIKKGKSNLDPRGSCVKVPGTKMCKKDANGLTIWKKGRRPASSYLKMKGKPKNQRQALKLDPLKKMDKALEKSRLKREISETELEKNRSFMSKASRTARLKGTRRYVSRKISGRSQKEELQRRLLKKTTKKEKQQLKASKSKLAKTKRNMKYQKYKSGFSKTLPFGLGTGMMTRSSNRMNELESDIKNQEQQVEQNQLALNTAKKQKLNNISGQLKNEIKPPEPGPDMVPQERIGDDMVPQEPIDDDF